MATRTTAAKVKEIIDTDLSDDVVDAYILGASYAVDQVFSDDTTLGSGHLAEIERWLAAHMIASTREQQISKAGAGGASVTYQGVTGKALEATYYGQMAMSLDTTGKLRGTMQGRTASLRAVPSFT